MWLSDQEVADPIMFVIADHKQRLPDVIRRGRLDADRGSNFDAD